MKTIKSALSVLIPLVAIMAVFAILYGFLLLGFSLGMTM